MKDKQPLLRPAVGKLLEARYILPDGAGMRNHAGSLALDGHQRARNVACAGPPQLALVPVDFRERRDRTTGTWQLLMQCFQDRLWPLSCVFPEGAERRVGGVEGMDTMP